MNGMVCYKKIGVIGFEMVDLCKQKSDTNSHQYRKVLFGLIA